MLSVACFNFKGGTAKTTTAINLGAALASVQRRVCLIDLDGQRTLSYGLGLDGNLPTSLDWLEGEHLQPFPTVDKHLSVLPGSLELFQVQAQENLFVPALEKLAATDVQSAIMDCPPGLSVVSTQAILSADRVLVPVLCEPASLKGLVEAIQLIRADRPGVPIEVVRQRYRPRLTLTREANEVLQAGAKDLGYSLLATTIPENIAVAESIAAQEPVTRYAPKSPGAKAYQELAKELGKLWGKHGKA